MRLLTWGVRGTVATTAAFIAAGAGLFLTAVYEPAVSEWLELIISRTGLSGLDLWAYIKQASNFLKPYAEVIKPLHDIGVVTFAVLFGIFQFLSKRKLKLKLDRIEQALSVKDEEFGDPVDVWLLHNPCPYREKRGLFQKRHPDEKETKYVAFLNLKGGVGKTTLAMNFAAYLDRELGKDTLLVDLDYQGSLSSAMLSACEIDAVDSNVNKLFDKNITGAQAIQLAAVSLQKKLPKTEIISAWYQFGKLENKLMLRWLIEDGYDRDIRHAVARVLWSPAVRKKFDVVIFDCPPRLTTGTVNAICASTHFLVPTVLDKMSAEAVGPTLKVLKRLSTQLNPKLQLLGAVGNLTQDDKLVEREERAKEMVSRALEGWSKNVGVFERTIPRRAVIGKAAGEDIAYLGNKREQRDFRELFNKLGNEIADKLWNISDGQHPLPTLPTDPSALKELEPMKVEEHADSEFHPVS